MSHDCDDVDHRPSIIAGADDANRADPPLTLRPASTTKVCPLTSRASSLARYTAALAMSIGSGAKPMPLAMRECSATAARFDASPARANAVKAVGMVPGAIALTR